MSGFRRALRRAVPDRVLDVIDLFGARRAGFDRPTKLDGPPGSRALVLAPHADDEVVGCGGMLRAHHDAGHPVTAVYLTDGRHGHADGRTPDETIARRRAEAERAADLLGIGECVFLDREDGKLAPDAATVREVAAVIDRVRPDVVYVPFVLDRHPDHLATNDIFVRTFARAGATFMCYGYEVWTPMLPNCVFDATPFATAKRAALDVFESQQEYFDLRGASLGFARYRSVLADHDRGTDGLAECFYRCAPDEYARLWARVTGDGAP